MQHPPSQLNSAEIDAAPQVHTAEGVAGWYASWLAARIACLAAIVTLGSVLRFSALQQRGLIYWDEGKYALEGVRLRGFGGDLIGLHSPMLTGKGIGSARPTHDLFIALSYAVLGIHDYAPLMVNALASVVGIVLTYFIAARLFSPRAGLMAALFLAVSEYDVIYARSAMPESGGNALLLVGVLIVVAGHAGTSRRMKSLSPIVPALLLGLASTANFRLVVYVAAFVAFDLWWILRRTDVRVAIARIPWWAAGLATVPMLWEIVAAVSAAHGVPLFRGDVSGSTSYLVQAVGDLHQGKAGLHFSLLPYLQWWVVREPLPLTALLIVGIALAYRRRTYGWVAAVTPLTAALILFSVGPFPLPRNMSAALPFAAILAAEALDTLCVRIPWARVSAGVLVAMCVAIGSLGFEMSWHLTTVRSGFAQTSNYLRGHHDAAVLTTTEIMAFYLRGSGTGCSALGMPRTLTTLSAYVAAGYHTAVLESHHNSDITSYIRKHGRWLAHFAADGGPAIGESLISSENANPPRAPSRPEYVNVYALDSMPLPRGTARTHTCNLDSVPP